MIRELCGQKLVNGDVVITHDATCAPNSVLPKLLFENVLYADLASHSALDVNKAMYTLEVYKVDPPAKLYERLRRRAQQYLTIPTKYVTVTQLPGYVGHAMLRRSGMVDVVLGNGKTVSLNENGAMTAKKGHAYLRLGLGQVLSLKRMLANNSTPLRLCGDELFLMCTDGELFYPMSPQPGELIVRKQAEQFYIADLGEVPGMTDMDTVTMTVLTEPMQTEHVVFYRQ